MTKTPALLDPVRALLHDETVSMLRVPQSYCKLADQICPTCGARGDFVNHGSYVRQAVKLLCDIPVETSLRVRRVLCCSCKHTHALIPTDIVPYCHYSISFCARVFELRYSRNHTVEQICLTLALPTTTFYRILTRSVGRLQVCTGFVGATEKVGKLCADIAFLIVTHLKCHRLKPFESGRLAPMFFDP